jgi:hypothetical protein
MKGSVGLSPLLVVLSVLIGITVIGPAGGILAIPIAAIIQVLIHDLVLSQHQASPAAEERRLSLQVFRWRASDLPRRLQGVTPGPAVVSAIVELDQSTAPPAEPDTQAADTPPPVPQTGTTAADEQVPGSGFRVPG